MRNFGGGERGWHTQSEGKTGLAIEVIGQLLKYMRLDHTIGAIWQKNASEKSRGKRDPGKLGSCDAKQATTVQST